MKEIKLNKWIVSISMLLIVAIISVPTIHASVEKNNTIELTREKAIEMASKNNNGLKKVDLALSRIGRNFRQAKDLSKSMDDMLKALERYESLYKKEQSMYNSDLYNKKQNYDEKQKYFDENKDNLEPDEKQKLQDELNKIKLTEEENKKLSSITLSASEQGELSAYKTKFTPIYGPIPPKFSDEDKFNNFIKNRDFPWYTLQGEIQKIDKSKLVTENAIKVGINKLYDGILQMEEGLKIQQELFNTQKKQYNQLVVKVKYGQAAEVEKEIADGELKKLELSIKSYKIKLDNLKNSLKQQLHIELNKNIQVQTDISDKCNIEFKSYDYYLNKALKERFEIFSSKIDLDTKQREFDITDDYLTDDDLAWHEAKETLYEKQVAEEDANKNINNNIKTLYISVQKSKEKMDLALENLEKYKTKSKEGYFNYDKGTIPLNVLWSIDLGKVKAEIEYNNAVVEYKGALMELDQSSGIGCSVNIKGAVK